MNPASTEIHQHIIGDYLQGRLGVLEAAEEIVTAVRAGHVLPAIEATPSLRPLLTEVERILRRAPLANDGRAV
jgi:hypothetical protein